MSTQDNSLQGLDRLIETFRKHFGIWFGITLVTTCMSLFYAVFKTRMWAASQAIIVREEAIGVMGRLGRFASTDEMKLMQETILDVARNPNAMRAALADVGPVSTGFFRRKFPTQGHIEALQEAIDVSAPNGAEFGKTEVIHIRVKDPDAERAVALTRAVCDQLDIGLQKLRGKKARGIVAELEKTVQLRRRDLDEATQRLEAVEKNVGSDLTELRVLNDAGFGDGNLRNSMTEMKNELRQVESRHATLNQLRTILQDAKSDPNLLIATPNQLLQSQQAIQRLKAGLVEAQLRTASLRGRMSDNHPHVLAARDAEQSVRGKIFAELDIAIRGIEADVAVNRGLADSLRQQLAAAEERFGRLASLRARYGNLVEEVKNRNVLLEQAQRDLAEAQGILAASSSNSASILTRVDEPIVGNRPLGPGRLSIVLVGMFGGLATGGGIVLLLATPAQFEGRRWSDWAWSARSSADPSGCRSPAPGRRASDQAGAQAGRRASDREARDSQGPPLHMPS